MQPLNVAIVAVEDFSPFHFSVPCIIFSDKVAGRRNPFWTGPFSRRKPDSWRHRGIRALAPPSS